MPGAITPRVLSDPAVCWPPSPVGLSPPCVGSQQTAFSHPDCRGFLILFVARHSLQRDLQDRGFPCEVVSPSSIPRRAGKAVKTDRIDAAELAEFYANGLLTVVSPPDVEVEQDRDLLAQPRMQVSALARFSRPLRSHCAWQVRQAGERPDGTGRRRRLEHSLGGC